jgi:ribosome-associated protein
MTPRARTAARQTKPKTTTTPEKEVRAAVTAAVEACQAKKAEDVAVLHLDPASGAFTDYFIVCTGSNPRQIQAISDEVEQRLGALGLQPTHVEGYNQAEWVLLDYVDLVVHVFSPKARNFYGLERLWKSAEQLTPASLKSGGAKRAAAKRSAKKSARPRTRIRRPAARKRRAS